ncbi:MAG: penicillin-binding protein 1C [Pseudomonadota bacterium]
MDESGRFVRAVTRRRTLARRAAIAGLSAVAAVCACVLGAFLVFDARHPLQLPGEAELSTEVVDADGRLLRAFATPEGRWRLRVNLDEVDREFIKLLIAYEDQRFWTHPGVDGLALVRAAGQWVANGRIVSGGSTLTMQLARLLEPRRERSLKAKLRQMARAIQLERKLGKREILQLYLERAPYGGNLEGIRAASLAYFGRSPRELSLAQAALLVALPQSPERRRPDRFPETARKARDTVLKRTALEGVIEPGEISRAARASVPRRRGLLPYHAPHLAERLKAAAPKLRTHKTTLNLSAQKALEQVARNAVAGLGREVSVALVLADAETGRILAEVGSADILDAGRSGWIDMTRAVRSPGSALKPFIYGLAFEQGMARPETLILDAPADFAGYRPENFDLGYQGEVSVRRALQLSLNVPAVHLLDAVGPQRLMASFRRAGVSATLPRGKPAGLAIGLGGVGITLRDLVQLYSGLANEGRAVRLHDRPGLPDQKTSQVLEPAAVWHVTDVLSGTPAPIGVARLPIAYKTGTSYGYRDAWSVGYDGRYVLGVWVGRPDNAPVPGMTGRKSAAPILFDAFSRLDLKRVPFPAAPAGAVRTARAELPVTLRRFAPRGRPAVRQRVPEPAPRIAYPPEGAQIELGETASGQPLPLMLKLQDGRPPYRWLADGKPVVASSRRRSAVWMPNGEGFARLTVIDAEGRAASVNVFLRSSN